MSHHADFDLEDLPPNELRWGAVYDLYGNQRDFSSRKVPLNTADLRYWDVDIDDDDDEDSEHDPHLNDPETKRLFIVVLRLLMILCYWRSGRFTTTQLRMIYLAWRDELGLREIARSEKKAPSVVSDRFNGTKGYGGLAKKAPEFWEFWTARNAKHQREGGKKGLKK